MERRTSCQRSESKGKVGCQTCPVGEIAIEALISAQPEDVPRDILLKIATRHCPEGYAPEALYVNPERLHTNGKSSANSESPPQAQAAL